ncbi:MAG: Y-family DNA polymerase [Desulfovibrio sp.]|nr:Y-family DNA polymerase [Desulfovibrio sp.]
MPSSSATHGLWGLVDCNSFYASCEQVFRPDLRGKAIVVLSNNDGCIIARSAEAKKLGIAMGEPYYKVQGLLKAKEVNVFSSNFPLYGDLSNRVMATMEEICPHIEQYSIDEAFIPLRGALAVNAEDIAVTLKETILRWTGIPVSVGVGPTRTLSKVANHLAKKGNGICVLRQDAPYQDILSKVPAEDIWGIGRRQAAKLALAGIRNAWQLAQANDAWLRKRLTVMGWQTALELRGIPVLDQDTTPTPRKSVVCSRSFGERIRDRGLLAEAIAAFTARAAERMRRGELLTRGIAVHIRTSYFEQQHQYEQTAQRVFRQGTNDTSFLQRTAAQILAEIFSPGFAYAKAGVLLFDLIPARSQQTSLLPSPETDPKRRELMTALDKINAKHGRDTVRFAAEGLQGQVWKMKQNKRSPRYTTEWEELPTAYCK